MKFNEKTAQAHKMDFYLYSWSKFLGNGFSDPYMCFLAITGA